MLIGRVEERFKFGWHCGRLTGGPVAEGKDFAMGHTDGHMDNQQDEHSTPTYAEPVCQHRQAPRAVALAAIFLVLVLSFRVSRHHTMGTCLETQMHCCFSRLHCSIWA